MLGPALTLLFAELDGRKDRQTSYEKALYQELLVLQALGAENQPQSPLGGTFGGERFRESPLGGVFGGDKPDSPFGNPVGLPVDFGLSGISNIPRRRGGPFDNNMAGIVVAPQEGGGGPPRMQINCGKTDCPNKEFK
jgi:hypothetical protein